MDSRAQFGRLIAGHGERLGAQILRVRSEVVLEAGIQLRSVLQEPADGVDVEIAVGDLEQELQVVDHRLADLHLEVEDAVGCAELEESAIDQVHHGEILRDLVHAASVSRPNLRRPAFTDMPVRFDLCEIAFDLVDVGRRVGGVEDHSFAELRDVGLVAVIRHRGGAASGHHHRNENDEDEEHGGPDGLGHSSHHQEGGVR